MKLTKKHLAISCIILAIIITLAVLLTMRLLDSPAHVTRQYIDAIQSGSGNEGNYFTEKRGKDYDKKVTSAIAEDSLKVVPLKDSSIFSKENLKSFKIKETDTNGRTGTAHVYILAKFHNGSSKVIQFLTVPEHKHWKVLTYFYSK